MIAYADTNVCVYLTHGEMRKLSKGAAKVLQDAELRISPCVVLELELLYEKGTLLFDSDGALSKLRAELGVVVCDLPFIDVVHASIQETWTRDPFDRLIVAQAKANGLAPLITSDRMIRSHYPRAIW